MDYKDYYKTLGVAATAVGKLLSPRQQERQEVAFQDAAERGSRAPARTSPTPSGTAPRTTPTAPQSGPQTIGSASWSEGRTQGGAAPAGAPVQTAEGDLCVPIKEWVNVNGKYVDQEVQACRPVADASGKFERVVPSA